MEKHLKEKLESFNADQLREICRKFDVKNYSKLNKENLILIILKEVDKKKLYKYLFPTWWDLNKNSIFGWASVIGLPIGIAAFALTLLTLFSSSNEKLDNEEELNSKYLSISDDTFDFAINNLSEDCLFFANFHDVSNIHISDMHIKLDSICNNNNLSNKIGCGNEILLEVHNIGERTITDLKLSWDFNFEKFEKFVKMYDSERTTTISHKYASNIIEEKNCKLGTRSMCPNSYYDSDLDFLHSGEHKQIRLPANFTKMVIIFAYYRYFHKKKIDFEDIPENCIPKIVAKFKFRDYKDQSHEEEILIYPSYCSSIGNYELGCFKYTVNFTKDETSLNWY